MRRLLALLPLLLMACAPGASPTPRPSPPSELLFLPGPAVRVVETRDGSVVATLPAGAFDAQLSGGGDVAEAYVVGDGVHRVRPGRPFRDDRTADATGRPPYQAALVPAPGLTTFVGQKTVLVTLSSDGQLAGYQAGTRIWSHPVPGATELRRLGSIAVLATGLLSALAADCPVGPIGEFHGTAVVPCPSAVATSVTGVPEGRPYDLYGVSVDITVLAWADGHWLSVGKHVTPLQKGAGGGRPALVPDASQLYWPARFPPAVAMASSRDGNFLYAVGGGRLRIIAVASERAVRDFPLDASDIALVSGG